MMTIAWPFFPNVDARESLEWLTDVIRCKTAEYRLSLRSSPRVTYDYGYLLDQDDYGIACEIARAAGGDDLYVPEWMVAVQVPSFNAATVSVPVDATRAPGYVALGHLLIWETNQKWEVCSITTVGSGTISISATTRAYTKPWITPLRLGTFAQPFSSTPSPDGASSGPDDDRETYIKADALFLVTSTEDLSGTTGIIYPTYLGDPVVNDQVCVVNNTNVTQRRDLEKLDSVTGGLVNYAKQSASSRAGVMAWITLDSTDLWALRCWLHGRKGKWKQFWVPSWNDDFTITREIGSSDDDIEIEAIGAASTYAFPFDLAIIDYDDGIWSVRVTGATAGDAGKELLTLSEPFDGTVGLDHIAHASKMTLSRFDSDRIEIHHTWARQASVVVPIVEVPIYP